MILLNTVFKRDRVLLQPRDVGVIVEGESACGHVNTYHHIAKVVKHVGNAESTLNSHQALPFKIPQINEPHANMIGMQACRLVCSSDVIHRPPYIDKLTLLSSVSRH